MKYERQHTQKKEWQLEFNVQFSIDVFLQLTQKISKCPSRYVAAFRDVYVAQLDIAKTIKKTVYIEQP